MAVAPRVGRSVRFSAAAIAQVQTHADRENRRWSDMLRILLKEALDARYQASKKAR